MPPAVIAVPSTALVLPAVAAADDAAVHGLRSTVSAALTSLPVGPTVVCAADPAAHGSATWLQPPDGIVHLGGLALRTAQAVVAGGLADGISSRNDHPGPDLAVLAVLVHTRLEAHVETPHLLALPADADAQELDRVAAALLTAVAGPLVVAGDLSAGHGPKPPRPEVDAERGAAFDLAVAAALDDPAALDALAAEAEAVAARGLSGLRLAARVAHQRGLLAGPPEVTVVDGVAGITCGWQRPN